MKQGYGSFSGRSPGRPELSLSQRLLGYDGCCGCWLPHGIPLALHCFGQLTDRRVDEPARCCIGCSASIFPVGQHSLVQMGLVGRVAYWI
jgi:hypothetical protein